MRVFPRSHWTASNPRPNQEGTVGLPYFTSPPTSLEFCTPNKNLLYVHRNPQDELQRLYLESIINSPLSDLDYNYAISQNTEGVYVIRGAHTKCSYSEKIKILMLIGDNEKPTDLLKKNQSTLLSVPVVNPIPLAPLRPGDNDVHVFDLIEYLIEHKYYDGKNDGTYGPITQHAVQRLQLDLGIKVCTGVYDEWVYHALVRPQREYIILSA